MTRHKLHWADYEHVKQKVVKVVEVFDDAGKCPQMVEAIAEACALLAMKVAWDSQYGNVDVAITISNPRGVTAKREYGIGELQIVPLSPTLRLLSKGVNVRPTDVVLRCGAYRFIVASRIPQNKDAEPDSQPVQMILPFWCVATGEGDAVNMCRSVITITGGWKPVEVPILHNTKVIRRGDALTIAKIEEPSVEVPKGKGKGKRVFLVKGKGGRDRSRSRERPIAVARRVA